MTLGALVVHELEGEKSPMSGCGGGWRIMACLPLIAALFAIAGCSGSDDGTPQSLAGTVLLDGRRLARGSILFDPEKRPLKGDDALMTGDLIVNGRFVIPRRRGLTPGLYKIMIFSGTEREDQEKARPQANAGPPPKELIPAKFNSDTELELEFKEGIKDLKIEIPSK